jgi:hypothetical protein
VPDGEIAGGVAARARLVALQDLDGLGQLARNSADLFQTAVA